MDNVLECIDLPRACKRYNNNNVMIIKLYLTKNN